MREVDDADLLEGSVITGLSFPSFSSVRLTCVNFPLTRKQGVASLDVFFSGVVDMKIRNAGDLLELKVTALSRREINPVRFRIDLEHGFITVDCDQLQVRKVMINASQWP